MTASTRPPEPSHRTTRIRLALATAVAVTAAVLPSIGLHIAQAETTTPTAAATPDKDWLHVKGNQIVDEADNPVWLTGTNWFGFNASERVFHGLWSGNINRITKEMAERGINIVRVPISTQLLLEWKAGTFARVNVNTYANPELEGKNSLQIFDYWLELCEKYGLKVLLDVHSAEADNSGHVQPMWYKGTFTTNDFYAGWEWVTARYKNNDTIVAMDLKNEPHGSQNQSPRAKWDGSTDADNWKYVAETAAKKILAINPKVLILVEGVEIYPKPGVSWSSTGLNDFYGTWWGGNLRGVKEFPINVGANQNQIMYSPHDYGPLVFDQTWFQSNFTKETLTNDVWRPNWLYIHESNTAPLLIGEWGGRIGQDPRQDKWMTALRDLMAEHKIHQTFWCLNPNSGDTGGLLTDDWQSWDETKYKMLKGALWQHNGKFVSLDHQVRLGGGASTTSITLAERYSGGTGQDDTAAPTAPGKPSASDVTSNSATLTWAASTDNVGVTSYDVLRGTGTAAATVVATVSGTSYSATGLSPSTTYAFSVRARDAAGNVSTASPAASVTTPAGGGPSGGGGCTAAYALTNTWSGGYMAEVTVTNDGTAPVKSWTVSWTIPSGTTIGSLWNGTLTTSGSVATVTNAPHNGALASKASTAFGLTGTGAGSAPSPITCSAS